MAALPTPRLSDGSVDLDGLARVADFALSRGVRGIVPCGGTGEYFDIARADRRRILEALLPVAKGRGLLIAGVGAATLRESVLLADHALQSGAAAVLLPPPHFYRYGDDELRQFFREAARAIGGPTLLYNLAAFVSPIREGVAIDLIASEPSIVGIKDSSGTLNILRRLTDEGIPAKRIQGHDAWLADSFRGGLLDGAISGPASVVPEMSSAMFESFGDAEAFSAAASFCSEFIRRIEKFPYPWALKWIAEWRGLGAAHLPFPLNEPQRLASAEFRAWFEDWQGRLESWRAGQDLTRIAAAPDAAAVGRVGLPITSRGTSVP